ncbi:molybdate ABC transporter substrate-binding protein [Kallotenue papyrolyticum]|uniref:molybdate ABC transporter substrate-binding protein n=1 Tax=Kallotenue papyrolyticum TaxID=1325125 RepID=UPI0004786599|nr:molybdate ABC transporter substrate-binding protein [Kallotenue papyrolyticum]
MARLLGCMLLLLGWLTACASTERTGGLAAPETATGSQGELIVFAAASLSEAFQEIGRTFEAQQGARVVFNFAGSQQLAQQLAQGAPADVFASANRAQMEAAMSAGRIAAGSERIFARNRLVVIVAPDNSAALRQLRDLARPGVHVVLAAKEVPVGRYSLEALDKLAADPGYGRAFRDAVLRNVVSYEENVRAVLSKVALGEADAGVVYVSDIAPGSEVGRIEIPDAFNVVAEYPIAPVRDARQPELAQQFIAAVFSPAGQATLQRYNFLPVQP